MVPTGDYLYASNRGEDTLVVFAINQTSGELTFRQRICAAARLRGTLRWTTRATG